MAHHGFESALAILAGCAWIGTLLAAVVVGTDARIRWADVDVRERRLWWAAVGTALVVRLATPFDWVRVFTGLDLLDRAVNSPNLPKYGAGLVGLLRPLHVLGVASPEGWISGLNVGVGVATVAGLSLAIRAWLPRPRVLSAVAWVLALTPVLVRHHRSETAFVVAFAAWLVGAASWSRWLRSGRIGYAWLAVAPLAAAAYTRPAFLVAAPVTVWALTRWLPDVRVTRRPRGALVALLWVLVPHALWLLAGALSRGDRGDLPAAVSPMFLLQLPVMLIGMNMAAWPHVFPVALTALGGWAAWRGGRSGDTEVTALCKASLCVGAALIATGMVDPVVVSMPRLQAPWLGLWAACATAAATAAVPVAHVRYAVAAFLLTAAATVPWLFRAENADHEDAMLRRVAAELAGKQGTLHWLDYGDAGADKVSRHYPRWRFRRPNAALSLRPLRDLPQADDPGAAPSDAEPRWVFLGVRCFARHRAPHAAAPLAFEHDACARARRRVDLVPVFEATVVNRGDVHFPWWPRQPTLRIGLYRLRKSTRQR